VSKSSTRTIPLNKGAGPDQLLSLKRAVEEIACSVSTLRNLLRVDIFPPQGLAPGLFGSAGETWMPSSSHIREDRRAHGRTWPRRTLPKLLRDGS